MEKRVSETSLVRNDNLYLRSKPWQLSRISMQCVKFFVYLLQLCLEIVINYYASRRSRTMDTVYVVDNYFVNFDLLQTHPLSYVRNAHARISTDPCNIDYQCLQRIN